MSESIRALLGRRLAHVEQSRREEEAVIRFAKMRLENLDALEAQYQAELAKLEGSVRP